LRQRRPRPWRSWCPLRRPRMTATKKQLRMEGLLLLLLLYVYRSKVCCCPCSFRSGRSGSGTRRRRHARIVQRQRQATAEGRDRHDGEAQRASDQRADVRSSRGTL
jgi:hypothetical protein